MRPHVDRLLRATAALYRLSVVSLQNGSRRKELVHARHVFAYLAREKLELSYPEIGRVLCRDHTTIMHAYAKISQQIDAADLAHSYLCSELAAVWRLYESLGFSGACESENQKAQVH